ncbi:MAG: E3 binding domain-containing protein [Deinococcus sp.]|uniref:E3 binding domain-containing protein n=1 Tax=Deinococcus sp. TaxID=47478 RepID=UPI0026DA7E8F|nr:E3 binding domain-containing protein [Deinococcus sp.]MDO4245416.1 E3 binding domain-containing protein [Deinococcus sp.]
MERIAPLAKILAEANGIEWQQLKGTGAGGMIVEQDILDYLSRVMSGEAEPPSTPVDAPPPDWNGEDLPGGGMFDANMLSKAGVESDIADFVQQSRSAPTPARTEPNLGQDDFELDDAEEVVPAAPAPAAPQGHSPFDIPPVSPVVAAPVTVEQPAPVAPVAPVTFPAARVEPQDQPPAAPAPVPAASGLGNLLSRLYHKEPERPAAPAPQPVQPQPAQPQFEIPAPVTPAPAAPVSGNAQAYASPFNIPPVQLHDTPAPVVETPAAPAPQPVLDIEPARDNDSDSMLMAEPAAAPVPAFTAQPAQAEPEQPADVVEVERVVPEEPVVAKPVEIEEEETATPQAAEEAPEETADLPTEEVQTTETEEPEQVEDAPTPAVVPAPAAAERGAVWFGTYLRRDAQVAQLHDLRQQLSEALERDVPLALLVARAAQRHAAALGLDSVALRDTARGLTRQVGSQQGLRDALQATDVDFGGTPSLLVVDAGALDMDDLHYPETLTLSVGRVQDGRAALSLQGDVDPEKAARFLASVAQTLEKPVILLV